MASSIADQESGYRQSLRSALREVIAIFVSSFRLADAGRNGGFLPFNPYPSSFRRRFCRPSH